MDFNLSINSIDAACENVESAYKNLESIKTKSDIESVIKQNLLTRVKNNLTDLIIISDILRELENNPDDELLQSSILELILGTEEILG